MAEPDAIFKNGGYVDVNEGKMYIRVYRYPSSYPMSSTLLCILDILTFVLTTAIFKNGGP